MRTQHQRERDGAEQRVRVEPGRTEQHGAEQRAPAERDGQARPGDQHVEAAPPGTAADLDTRDDHDEPGNDPGHERVEAGQQSAVEAGERAEHHSERGHDPHLVAEEERSDRADRDTASRHAAAQRPQRHAHAVVEAGEREVTGEEQPEHQVPHGRGHANYRSHRCQLPDVDGGARCPESVR